MVVQLIGDIFIMLRIEKMKISSSRHKSIQKVTEEQRGYMFFPNYDCCSLRVTCHLFVMFCRSTVGSREQMEAGKISKGTYKTSDETINF